MKFLMPPLPDKSFIPYLSKDLCDEVDIGSGARQYSPYHLHVCQLLFIHGA